MLHNFSNLVNYLPWKQVEATIKGGHNLLNHITGEWVPKKYTTKSDQENGTVRLVY